jgi:hypothetical protein
MISKIQKAGRYAQEPQRLRFLRFEVAFQGNHNDYVVTYDRGQWQCGCDFFLKRGVCSHTMALEKILGVMLPEPAVKSES